MHYYFRACISPEHLVNKFVIMNFVANATQAFCKLKNILSPKHTVEPANSRTPLRRSNHWDTIDWKSEGYTRKNATDLLHLQARYKYDIIAVSDCCRLQTVQGCVSLM